MNTWKGKKKKVKKVNTKPKTQVVKSPIGIDKYQLDAKALSKNADDIRISLVKNATPQELKFKVLLKELNIQYNFQKIYFTGFGFYVVDFYLPEYNIVVELDGSQHMNVKDRKWDTLRTENLIHIHKIKEVVRFNNSELSIDESIKSKILNALD